MRLIKLDVIDRITQNVPDTFRSYRNVDGLIAEYYGSDSSIPDYTGPGRPDPVQKYQTVMTAREFKLQLTGDEFDKMRVSTSKIVSNAYFRLANRNDVVDTESPEFAAVAAEAVLAGDWTQARSDIVSLGIKI